MKKIFFVAIALVAFAITSCNKDQKAVKNIEGSWKAISTNGENLEPDEQATYTFTSCKLKSEEYCPAVLTYPDNSVENFEYSITGDGKVITWKTDDNQGNSFLIPGTIDELTNSTMSITFTFFESQTTIFEKV